MLRDIFNSVENIGQYGIISLIIFLLFFTFLLINTIALKEKDVDEFSRLPLDESSKKTDGIHET
jgi:hypothetical protein